MTQQQTKQQTGTLAKSALAQRSLLSLVSSSALAATEQQHKLKLKLSTQTMWYALYARTLCHTAKHQKHVGYYS